MGGNDSATSNWLEMIYQINTYQKYLDKTAKNQKSQKSQKNEKNTEN